MAGRIWTPEAIGDRHFKLDACVVGSGAGGAVVASALARSGMSVALLEEGPYVPPESFPLDAREAMPRLYRNGGATMIGGNSPVLFTEGRCVGGSTTVNAGICYRAPDAVLEAWHRKDGLEELAPAALAPYYERVEARLGVREVPRAIWSEDARRLERAAERLGWHTTVVRRNAPDCQGHNLCLVGCPTGAKRSTLVTSVPEAIAAGAQLLPRTRAERVVTRRGRAVGVEARVLEGGDRVRIDAEVVVLAGGALQTPQLLFKSGLDTRAGRVGKNLYLHPNCKIVGEFETETFGWKGAIQGLQVDQFADEGYTFFSTFVPPGLMAFGLPTAGDAAMAVMRNYNRLASWGVLIEDGHPGEVRPGAGTDPRAIYHFDAEDRRRILRGIRLLAELLFAAEARRLFLPLHRLPEIRTPSDLAKLEAAAPRMADIELLTVHAMGTCRMSARPDRGVVDPWNEHHEVKSLFVADASILPGPLRVNPMLTIMALAERCADGILERRGARAG